jgi:hypothetical protein
VVVDRLDLACEFWNMHASQCILRGTVQVMQTTGCDTFLEMLSVRKWIKLSKRLI